MITTNRPLPTYKTRTIAGRKITLATGTHYIASRPFATRGRTLYPVSIQPMIGAPEGAQGLTIAGLTYDQADRLVNAFNNGTTSFDGRAWA